MPFYELICIVRKGKTMDEVREFVTKDALTLMSSIARIAGRTILNRNGVIRNLRNLGLLQLPQRARAHSAYHLEGHYFLMRFYSSPYVIRDIARHLSMDPRMIRHNVVKLGDGYVTPACKHSPHVD